MSDVFELDGDNFHILKKKINVNDGILSIDIRCDGNEIDELPESSKWSFLCYPLRFYFHNYPIPELPATISIDNDVMNNYNISLFADEHLDLYGQLTVEEDKIILDAFVKGLFDRDAKLLIKCSRLDISPKFNPTNLL